ncbi:DUF1007 family protein [Paracoccus sp. Z330]|uniref:DUF1007 family protein n=1 Tax=Paracoccus onchidii TaxID=3017813 RepID=A0ABT4ZFX4_9RHOB|nr:DUF1007 family protein [Paracoccus onchidii]MDB6178235.1 DUF1007 family protein [Paracoccus onchidii]
MHLPAAVLTLMLTATTAMAHPHVFVDVRGSFLLDEQQRLTALRIHWTYDAFTSLVLYDTLQLDDDGDGQLDADDLRKIERGETDWPQDYEGDTYLFIDGQKTALSRPRDAKAESLGDRIGVGFTLELETPVDLVGQTANLKIYDPIYYYAYSVTEDSGLEESNPDCDLRIAPFEPDGETSAIQAELAALSREEIPEDTEIGALFAENIYLTCA